MSCLHDDNLDMRLAQAGDLMQVDLIDGFTRHGQALTIEVSGPLEPQTHHVDDDTYPMQALPCGRDAQLDRVLVDGEWSCWRYRTTGNLLRVRSIQGPFRSFKRWEVQ